MPAIPKTIIGPRDKKFSEAFLTELTVVNKNGLPNSPVHTQVATFELHKNAGWLQVNIAESTTKITRRTYFCLDEPAARALHQQLDAKFGAGNGIGKLRATLQAIAAGRYEAHEIQAVAREAIGD